MKNVLTTWWGVFAAAVSTTTACILTSQVMVHAFFDGQTLVVVRPIAPLITIITAFPFSFFIWSQLRRNIKIGNELQRLVDRDRLTDAATRDFFFARMRSDPEAYGISLMVDIDFFKAVNDTFGHLAGDAVIASVARILQNNTRVNDIVCRFGGEEFIVFLHEQGTVDGFEVAERMRKAIAAEVVDFDGQTVRVTVSIGGSLRERVADVDLAIQQADHALYRAKSSGRNRTIFASQPIAESEQKIA